MSRPCHVCGGSGTETFDATDSHGYLCTESRPCPRCQDPLGFVGMWAWLARWVIPGVVLGLLLWRRLRLLLHCWWGLR